MARFYLRVRAELHRSEGRHRATVYDRQGVTQRNSTHPRSIAASADLTVTTAASESQTLQAPVRAMLAG
jgi:hypothetical protein